MIEEKNTGRIIIKANTFLMNTVQSQIPEKDEVKTGGNAKQKGTPNNKLDHTCKFHKISFGEEKNKQGKEVVFYSDVGQLWEYSAYRWFAFKLIECRRPYSLSGRFLFRTSFSVWIYGRYLIDLISKRCAISRKNSNGRFMVLDVIPREEVSYRFMIMAILHLHGRGPLIATNVFSTPTFLEL